MLVMSQLLVQCGFGIQAGVYGQTRPLI